MTLIVIGSVAAKYHFSNFRRPDDLDLISTSSDLTEVENIKDIRLLKEISHKKKFRLNQLSIEVEWGSKESNFSSQKIAEYCKKLILPEIVLPYFPLPVIIAPSEVLLLIKQSHIIFPINWQKNLEDYHFLKKHLVRIPEELLAILQLRQQEVEIRRGIRRLNFNVTNQEFFDQSAKLVTRYVDHDLLHQKVKFYNQPIFQEIKKDLNRAEIDWEMFQQLPHDKQICNLAEEVMALSLERDILPYELHYQKYSLNQVLYKFLEKLCTHYLPIEFRLFAIDHYQEVFRKIKEKDLIEIAKEIIEEYQLQNIAGTKIRSLSLQ